MAPHTTATQKLLALADAYENKARVLREAASELNGHLVAGAVGTIAGKLRTASALRGETLNRSQVKEARRVELRELLADGADHKTRDLAAALRERGHPCDHSTVNNDMNAMGVTRKGHKTDAVWHLASSNGHQPPTRVAKPKAKRKSSHHSAPGRDERRRTSAKLLARIAAAGKPVTGKKLGQGIGALLRRGYVEKTADGYVRTDKEFVV